MTHTATVRLEDENSRVLEGIAWRHFGDGFWRSRFFVFISCFFTRLVGRIMITSFRYFFGKFYFLKILSKNRSVFLQTEGKGNDVGEMLWSHFPRLHHCVCERNFS